MLYIPYVNDILVDDYLVLSVACGVNDRYDSIEFQIAQSDGFDGYIHDEDYEYAGLDYAYFDEAEADRSIWG